MTQTALPRPTSPAVAPGATLALKMAQIAARGLVAPDTSTFSQWVAVMLKPSAKSIEAIRPFSKTPDADLHCTLVMLGKTADLSKQGFNMDHLTQALKPVCDWNTPLDAKIGGVTRFHAPEGSNDPVVLSINSKGLGPFRTQVITALEQAGLHESTEHGYTPHMTIGYLPQGSPLTLRHFPVTDIVFDALVLGFGDQYVELPLQDNGMHGDHDRRDMMAGVDGKACTPPTHTASQIAKGRSALSGAMSQTQAQSSRTRPKKKESAKEKAARLAKNAAARNRCKDCGADIEVKTKQGHQCATNQSAAQALKKQRPKKTRQQAAKGTPKKQKQQGLRARAKKAQAMKHRRDCTPTSATPYRQTGMKSHENIPRDPESGKWQNLHRRVDEQLTARLREAGLIEPEQEPYAYLTDEPDDAPEGKDVYGGMPGLRPSVQHDKPVQRAKRGKLKRIVAEIVSNGTSMKSQHLMMPLSKFKDGTILPGEYESWDAVREAYEGSDFQQGRMKRALTYAKQGDMHPVDLHQHAGGQVRVKDGHHRVLAAMELGLDAIPYRIDGAKAMAKMMLESKKATARDGDGDGFIYDATNPTPTPPGTPVSKMTTYVGKADYDEDTHIIQDDSGQRYLTGEEDKEWFAVTEPKSEDDFWDGQVASGSTAKGMLRALDTYIAKHGGKKPAAKKTPAKPAKKVSAKKAATAVAKKTSAKKTAVKKPAAKKPSTRKTSTSSRAAKDPNAFGRQGQSFQTAGQNEEATLEGQALVGARKTVGGENRHRQMTLVKPGSKTEKYLRQKYGIPPAYTDIKFNHSRDEKATDDEYDGMVYTALDPKTNKWQPVYTVRWRNLKDGVKEKKVGSLTQNFNKVAKHLESDANGKDERKRNAARALMVQAYTGLRIGNPASAAEGSFGASTLQAKHVSLLANNKVKISFKGKGRHKRLDDQGNPVLGSDGKPVWDAGSDYSITVKSKPLHDMLADAKIGKKPSEPLFGNADHNAYLKGVSKTAGISPAITSHNFRHNFATKQAAQIIDGLRAPVSEAGFQAAQKKVVEQVAALINDTKKIAYGSYIQPSVWDAIRFEPEWKDASIK